MLVFSQPAFSAFTFVLAALGSDASCSAGGSLQSECGQQRSDSFQSNEGSRQNDEAVEAPSLMQMNTVEEHERFERGEDNVEVIVAIKDAVGQRAVNGFQAPGTSGMFLNAHHSLEAISMSKYDLDALLKSPGINAVEEAVEVKPYVITPYPEAIFEGLGAEDVPYGITMVQAPDVEQGPNPVKVCVVDTGYGLGHPDLPIENVTGTNTPSGLWNEDGHGHGTHCAGSIGAIGGNDKGVTSVNPDPTKFTFHIGKGLSNSGSGSTTGVLAAVQGCADAGAKIISMSLGGGGWGQVSHDLYKKLYEEDGILIVAAAGNKGDTTKSYPASYPHIMSVAAVDSNEAKAGFSQWNDQVEIAGPGVLVKSPITTNGGKEFSYASWSGTSMACPHVAGVAALVWSHFPNCSNSQIRRVLQLTAKDKGDAGCDEKYGWGIVQASAAYDLLDTKGCEAGGPSKPPVTEGGCKFWGQPTPAPTPAPTFPPDCPNTLTVKVVTDVYPAETTWFVKDSEGIPVISGGPYSTANTQQEITKACLTIGLYDFTIKDSYGDGLCCSYGDGSYNVALNGQDVASGGEFASAESVEINVGSPPPTPPTPPPTPVPTPDPQADCSGTYQAETATLSGAKFANDHTGWTGTGFADYIKAVSDYVEWSLVSCAGGKHTATFRYALARGNRPLRVEVNGVAAVDSLDFPKSGNWKTWKEVQTSITLLPGSNKVKLVAIGKSGANIDKLDIRPFVFE